VNRVRFIRWNIRATARGLLPLLAAAWLTAAPAPCAGMGLAGVADSAAEDRQHLDHLASTSPVGADSATHNHGHCPHCPPVGVSEQGAAPSAHTGCDATQGTRDNRVNAPAKWDLKHSLPASLRVSGEASFHPAGVHRALKCVVSPSSRVPLNIRHCVYLI
jgi:hypothetical protein